MRKKKTSKEQHRGPGKSRCVFVRNGRTHKRSCADEKRHDRSFGRESPGNNGTRERAIVKHADRTLGEQSARSSVAPFPRYNAREWFPSSENLGQKQLARRFAWCMTFPGQLLERTFARQVSIQSSSESSRRVDARVRR